MRVQIVSFRCVVKNKLGQFISSSFNHDVSTSSLSPQPKVLPGFIEALKSLKQGEKREIVLTADQAYGFYDPGLVVEVPRSKLSKGKSLRLGDLVQGKFEQDQMLREYRVSSCSAQSVSLDGNHPLAGQDLIFNVEITDTHEEFEEDSNAVAESLLN